MHVVEVDRLCSTTSHTDTQVLTHSQLLPPSEWTSQSWAVQHLDGLLPDDARVMAVMRHEKAGAADATHQFQPLFPRPTPISPHSDSNTTSAHLTSNAS